MERFLCDIDWPTLLAFIVVILTIISTTFLTIRNQNKATSSQLAISREVADREREKSRAEFISASRQAWINSLREEVSFYISGIFSVWDLWQQKNGRAEVLKEIKNPEYAMSELGEWSVRYGSAISMAQKHRTQIYLLLNPGEDLSKDLIGAVDAALKTVQKKSDPTEANTLIIRKLQPILKEEWERVKALDDA
jgi:hypothetical protein